MENTASNINVNPRALTETQMRLVKQAVKHVCRKRYDLIPDTYQSALAGCQHAVNNSKDQLLPPQMYVIARNRAIDYIKSRKNSYSYQNKIPHVHFVISSGDMYVPADLVQSATDDATHAVPDALRVENPENDIALTLDIIKALSSLDSRSVDMVDMYYWQGTTQAEIAKKHNISRSMVSKALHKIYDDLRKHPVIDAYKKYYGSEN